MAGRGNEQFHITVVYDQFSESLHEADNIKLKNYLASYKEISKFFNLMGTVFGFVSSDVQSKINILTEFIENEKSKDAFDSVKSMIKFEMEKGLLQKENYVSGSRTLLRLHRGLDFINKFLRSLGGMQNCDKTSTVCQEAYNTTLAQYHPWIVQKAAKLAMHTMPKREQLLKRVCGSDEDIKKAIDILPKMLEISDEVYNRIENLYTVNNLHSLP